jgi:hypothetical protein
MYATTRYNFVLPNGPMVSEEKIEMFTTDEGRQVMAIAHMTLQVR